MAADGDKRPIIVKKIKKGGGGHHGGAWKVAYADFVTAMMAFFLLLWLLSTSSKATLEGISEYFTPTTGIKDSQGIGFKGGISATEGIARSKMSPVGVVPGQTPSGVVSGPPDDTSPEESNEEQNLFKEGATAINQAFQKDPEASQFQENVQVQQTTEGLRIDITDSDKNAMFQPNSPKLTPQGELVLGKIGELLNRMPNYLSISGHTDGSPVEAGTATYSNWELSSDRAQAARRFLLKAGVDPARPKRVSGMADTDLLVPSEPRNPRNRRISVILLRGSHVLIPDAALPGDAVEEAPAPAPAASPVPKAPKASGH